MMRSRSRAALLVIAPILLIAALSLMQRRASAKSAIAIPVTPLAEAVGEARQASEDSSRAARFLARARGTSPVLCALASRGLGGGFGAHPETDVAWGRESGVTELVRWADDGPGDAASIDPLLAALADPDRCASRLSAQLLGRAQEPRATQGLLAALREASPVVRASAAVGLGYTASTAAVDPLVAALRDADASVRASAAWALGEIEHRRAVPALIAALKDADALVRRSAARALGSIEDPSAIPALTELLRADRDAGVRTAAAWALGEIAG
jgi:HEAT repeat protein